MTYKRLAFQIVLHFEQLVRESLKVTALPTFSRARGSPMLRIVDNLTILNFKTNPVFYASVYLLPFQTKSSIWQEILLISMKS